MTKVTKLMAQFKREDLLDDRSQYDQDDLQKAYPELTKRDVRMLYLRLQKWRKAMEKKNSKKRITVRG